MSAHLLAAVPAWHAHAACAGPVASLFYDRAGETPVERRQREDAALDVCRTCTVRHPCLDDALEPPPSAQPHEVQGGHTRHQRVRERNHRQRGGTPRYDMADTGRPKDLEDSAPTVALLHDLLAQGRTVERIAAAANLSIRCLNRLVRTPPQPQVARSTALAVAAVHTRLHQPQGVAV